MIQDRSFTLQTILPHFHKHSIVGNTDFLYLQSEYTDFQNYEDLSSISIIINIDEIFYQPIWTNDQIHETEIWRS